MNSRRGRAATSWSSSSSARTRTSRNSTSECVLHTLTNDEARPTRVWEVCLWREYATRHVYATVPLGRGSRKKKQQRSQSRAPTKFAISVLPIYIYLECLESFHLSRALRVKYCSFRFEEPRHFFDYNARLLVFGVCLRIVIIYLIRYFAEMPWAAIPYGDAGRRRALAARCGVRGIPTLATIGSDGVVINQKAKESAIADAKVRKERRASTAYIMVRSSNLVGSGSAVEQQYNSTATSVCREVYHRAGQGRGGEGRGGQTVLSWSG